VGVAEVVETTRGRPDRATTRSRTWVTDSGLRNWPARLQNIQSSAPWGRASLRRWRRQQSSSRSVPASRSTVRQPVRVLTPNSTRAAADVLEGSGDRQPCSGPVEVGPLEPDDLSAAHAGVDREVQGRVEALVSRCGEEGPNLLGGPGSGCRIGRRAPAGACALGDVAQDELALGRVQHAGERRPRGCLRSEARPARAAGRSERFVEAVEMVGSEPAQGDLADGRVDVAIDEPGVPVRGRGPDTASAAARSGSGTPPP